MSEVALAPGDRQILQAYLDGTAPLDHLLLVGPPGTGKSTVADIVITTLTGNEPPRYFGKSGNVWRMNAAKDARIEALRDGFRDWARGFDLAELASGKTAPLRFLVLDEVEGASQDFLFAARVEMERWQERVRWILIGNEPPRDRAIQDRCKIIRMTMDDIPVDERARVLRRIIDAEGLEADNDIIELCAQRNTDSMRALIRWAQESFHVHGELRTPPEAEERPVPGRDTSKRRVGKLTDDEIQEIKRRHRAGASLRQLAEEFDVGKSTIERHVKSD